MGGKLDYEHLLIKKIKFKLKTTITVYLGIMSSNFLLVFLFNTTFFKSLFSISAFTVEVNKKLKPEPQPSHWQSLLLYKKVFFRKKRLRVCKKCF